MPKKLSLHTGKKAGIAYMVISYNWLSDYLPVTIDPARLSEILTSVGLEVESLEKYESVKGSLKGLVIGEVMECVQHPGADKLKLTKVDINGDHPLSIVCGAPNVAVGQKVVVALVATTIYPVKGDPITIKVAKIRGEESYGMICAADEIGIADDHAGVLVLPGDIETGSAASAYFKPVEDYLIGIGLTPNHMDAMSHMGVARDVCAYLSHHELKEYRVKIPGEGAIKKISGRKSVTVSIENTNACQRYSGVSISDIKTGPSPAWMQARLKAIGVRPISNIVDITNYVLHELGQPLHAFDADEIAGDTLFIKNLPEGTPFVTLDDKERKLSAEDLMICDTAGPVCIAGVFGGARTGVKETTTHIFLESAWFNPAHIRKTSFRHGLRTDAATHFEKGMDISNTVTALKRAAFLIQEIAGGVQSSEIVDIYPHPKKKTEVTLGHRYLQKLSGKNYDPNTARNILSALEFEILKDGPEGLRVAVPFHKPDIQLPADIVEEIMRIDGYDHILIPSSITLSPSVETGSNEASFKEKTADYLASAGFYEIFTNSITNSAYFSAAELQHAVRMINNLSAELNVMRPSLLETGLESIAFNLNRKQHDLSFFEFGKSYSTTGAGKYTETNHLGLYITGRRSMDSWKTKGAGSDLYYVKGLCAAIMQMNGLPAPAFQAADHEKFEQCLTATLNGEVALEAGLVNKRVLKVFDIRQPVLFADFRWDTLMRAAASRKIVFSELPKQLAVYRDLALVVDKLLPYAQVEKTVAELKLNKLQEMQLFDIFESEKIGADKKSLAVSFSFLDEEKTLTDKEIDAMMQRIMTALEKNLSAEIRK